MTRLLLDYPWPLEAGLGPDEGPQNVLRDYLHLLVKTKLSAGRFIEEEEYIAFWKSIEGRRGRGRFDLVIRLLDHCQRNSNSICRATPVSPEPPHLRESWKRALRDELGNFNDWRNPQIVYPEVRRMDWHPVGKEAEILCEPCDGQSASEHLCVLVNIEDYVAHPFAISDFDPWDVRCTAPSGVHPCYLPNPLLPDCDPLQNHFRRVIPIAQLYEKLAEARRKSCPANGKYFYIPHDTWRPETISQAAWREGRAFPHEFSKERQQTGYRDFSGMIWLWHKGRGGHKGEDHWDVQMGGKDYIKVKHTGEPL